MEQQPPQEDKSSLKDKFFETTKEDHDKTEALLNALDDVKDSLNLRLVADELILSKRKALDDAPPDDPRFQHAIDNIRQNPLPTVGPQGFSSFLSCVPHIARGATGPQGPILEIAAQYAKEEDYNVLSEECLRTAEKRFTDALFRLGLDQSHFTDASKVFAASRKNHGTPTSLFWLRECFDTALNQLNGGKSIAIKKIDSFPDLNLNKYGKRVRFLIDKLGTRIANECKDIISEVQTFMEDLSDPCKDVQTPSPKVVHLYHLYLRRFSDFLESLDVDKVLAVTGKK